MRRLLLLTLITLVLAAIVHFATILAIPFLAPNGGWSRIAALADEEGVTVLPPAAPGESVLPMLDPAIAYAVCPFDVSENPFGITAVLPAHYWSVAFHNRRGTVFYAINYEAAAAREFAIEIRNPEQMRQFRIEQGEAQEQVLYLETPSDTGFALFRAFVAHRAQRESIEAVLEATACEPLEAPAGAEEGAVPMPRVRP